MEVVRWGVLGKRRSRGKGVVVVGGGGVALGLVVAVGGG